MIKAPDVRDITHGQLTDKILTNMQMRLFAFDPVSS